MDIVVVYCTTPNKTQAKSIARTLVKNKLAACVSLTPNVKSYFSWEGELCNENEVLLTIKTRREYFKKVKIVIESMHDYTVPEIIALPVIECGEEYAKWLETETEPLQN